MFLAVPGEVLGQEDLPTPTALTTVTLSPFPDDTAIICTSTEVTVADTPTDSLTALPSSTPTPTNDSAAALASGLDTLPLPPSPSPTAEIERVFSDDYVADEVLVGITSRNPSSDLLQFLESHGAEVIAELPELGVLQIRVPAGQVLWFVTNLGELPGVAYAEPNYYIQMVDTIPSDPGWANQYGPAAIRAPQGWDLSTGSAAVTIAILDTGVDLGHPDVAGKIVPGYDFVNNDAVPQDDNGHGTHVAGIAAALANNGIGIAGISWGARLMPVKVLNAGGSGTYANAAAGVVWAADQGAQIINLSLGGSLPSSVLEDAVIYAYDKGATLVAASGNAGSNLVLYPARYPQVIAVAATDSANNRAGFSNYGAEIDMAAPGVSIYSTTLGGGYGYRSGTSMAAPMVAGAAAILAGLPANNSPALISWELGSTALDLGAPGWDIYYGSGLIQLDAAIRLASPAPAPSVSIPRPKAAQIATPTSGAPFYPYPSATPSPTSTASSTAALEEIAALEETATPTIAPAYTLTSAYTLQPPPTSTAALQRANPGADYPPMAWTGLGFMGTGGMLFLYAVIWKIRNDRRFRGRWRW